MKTKKTIRSLSFFALLLTASPLIAASIIVNGDFSANASSFTTFPGYRGFGANPEIESWNFIDLSGGTGGNAGINGPDAVGVGEPFGPTTTVDISNYAFVQNGTALIAQNLPTMLPNQEYSISIAAANRAGNPDATGRIQIGDGAMTFYSSGDQSFTTESFQTITATFTTPSSFNGFPSIQLYGFTSGDNTVAYSNVVLEAIPEPTSVTLLGGALLFSVLRRRR
ncbi:MAG: PEP-CTERM sorting domain-containing protein [Akkermansiaceae bacterium]